MLATDASWPSSASGYIMPVRAAYLRRPEHADHNCIVLGF